MINLHLSVEDEPVVGSDATMPVVILTAFTNGTSARFFRRVGQYNEEISSPIEVQNGVAVYRDRTPIQKALLRYTAVNNSLEQSNTVDIVVPRNWSLTRPTLSGDIRLGNLVLNTVDERGTVWTLSDIDGWWNLPEVEIPIQRRGPEDDGAYAESGRFIERSLILSGVFLPQSADLLPDARTRLLSQLDARRETVLRVDESPPRQLSVRPSGKTRINTVRSSGLTEFAIELVAADPVKLSVDESVVTLTPRGTIALSNGRVYPASPAGRLYDRDYLAPEELVEEVLDTSESELVNLGNYPTCPTVTFKGPVSNPQIRLVGNEELGISDQIIQLNMSLVDGDSVEIDIKNHTVILNKTISRRGAMDYASTWFQLQPGRNTVRYTATATPNNTTTAQVSMRSAWIG